MCASFFLQFHWFNPCLTAKYTSSHNKKVPLVDIENLHIFLSALFVTCRYNVLKFMRKESISVKLKINTWVETILLEGKQIRNWIKLWFFSFRIMPPIPLHSVRKRYIVFLVIYISFERSFKSTFRNWFRLSVCDLQTDIWQSFLS